MANLVSIDNKENSNNFLYEINHVKLNVEAFGDSFGFFTILEIKHTFFMAVYSPKGTRGAIKYNKAEACKRDQK